MQYLLKNYPNIIIYSLVIVMVYLVSKLIINNPGMSISGWLFGLGPVVAIFIIIAIFKMSSQMGYNILTIFSISSFDFKKGHFLLASVLAVILGVAVILNPFDFLMPLFIGSVIALFLLSVYMLVNDKPIDAIGLLMISLPLISYAEFEIMRKIDFTMEWITIKIAIILLFSTTWVIVNVFMYKKPLVKGKFNTIVLIFIIATFFSAVLSTDIDYSLQRWLFEVAYPLLFYFLIINSIRHEKDIPKFMSYLVASVFLNLLLVLYYFAKYGGGNPTLDSHLLHLNFADGVLVANVLIMIMPIVIAFLITAHTKSLKLLIWTLIAMGILGVILSFSRTAQVSMVIGLLAFCILKKTRKYVILTIAVAILVFVFNYGRLEPYMDKYKSLTSLENVVHTSSMEKRYGGWRAAIGMFKDHPLTGVGIGRFNQEYENYGVLYYSHWASGYVPMVSAHNMYINYLAETGMIGILLLLTIFSTIVIKGLSIIRNADSNNVFKYSLLVSVIVFLVNNIFSGMTFAYVKEIDKGIIFWSIAAIIISYGAVEKNQGRHLPDKGLI